MVGVMAETYAMWLITTKGVILYMPFMTIMTIIVGSYILVVHNDIWNIRFQTPAIVVNISYLLAC